MVDTHPQLMEYFDLKPVTGANDNAKLELVNQQMTAYDNVLQPLGYRRGNSRELTFGMDRMPFGVVQDGDDSYLVSLILQHVSCEET